MPVVESDRYSLKQSESLPVSWCRVFPKPERENRKCSDLSCRREQLRMHFSSAASAAELHWSHQGRSETLFCCSAASLPFIHDTHPWIPGWVNGAYRWTWRECAPERSLGSSAHRLRCGRREGSLFGSRPSLPPFYSPPFALPSSVTVSLILFHFSAHLPTNKYILSCLFLVRSINVSDSSRSEWEK